MVKRRFLYRGSDICDCDVPSIFSGGAAHLDDSLKTGWEGEDYWNKANPKDLIINIMVGDLQRIKEYPKLGYQIAQDIPGDVWTAYEELIKKGYTEHLIR